MAAPKSGRRGTKSRTFSARRSLALVGLAVFLVLDIALVGWAINANRSPPPVPEALEGTSTSTTVPEPVGGPPTTTVPEPVEGPEPAAIPPTRLLSALNSTTAWRSTIGLCPTDPPTPELTTDGGDTWKPSALNAATGASAIASINVISESRASMVAFTSDECTPTFVQTYVAGDNWAESPDGLANAWYLDPVEAGTIYGPQGDIAAPCPTVVGLAASDDKTAVALCSDHTVFLTKDGGAEWGAPMSVPGAAAITTGDSGFLLAVTDQDSCDGVQLLALEETADTDAVPQGECREAIVKPGEIAMSEGDGTLWLWAGKQLSRTTDGGGTWH